MTFQTVPASPKTDRPQQDGILPPITGVLLAGGLSRRMAGQHKAQLQLGEHTLLQHVAERAAPQVDQLLLNSNADGQLELLSPKLRQTIKANISDNLQGFIGPLAGVLAAMQWCQEYSPQTQWLASFACDTPFFPRDCVQRLLQRAQQDSQTAEDHTACRIYTPYYTPYYTPCCPPSYNASEEAGQLHPAFSLWHLSLLPQLHDYLVTQQQRRLQLFIRQQAGIAVEFSALQLQQGQSLDPFFNINTPDHFQQAQALLPCIQAQEDKQ